jgi:tripartite-type tricarboxylate transporter receptor subunit TctC
MNAIRVLLGVICACIILNSKSASAFPDRPINLVVPWGVGGGGDRAGRVVANLLGAQLGVSIPVINVTGASGQVGLTKVLGEPADGYNIIEVTSDSYILFARPKPPFQVSDFLPIAVIDQQPSAFFVRDDSPWKTWSDVIEAAKTKNVTVAGSGIGTQSDVTVNWFNRNAKARFVSVPFDDPGLRWSSLLGKHTDLLYAQYGDLETYLSGKKMRPILSFSDERLPGYKDIPTAKELGYSIDVMHFRAIAVRRDTPSDIYEKLIASMNVVSHSPEYKKMLEAQAALPDSYIAGANAREYIETWVKQVRDLFSQNAKQ